MSDQVWEKGTVVSNHPADVRRKDFFGTWISKASYGFQSEYGWVIDHITPRNKGGEDTLSNYRPLHWKNNARKSDGRLTNPVKTNGDHNIDAT